MPVIYHHFPHPSHPILRRSLQFLHQHRILHGDLKAANVLLASSNLDRRKYIAKVGAWGWGNKAGREGRQGRVYWMTSYARSTELRAGERKG